MLLRRLPNPTDSAKIVSSARIHELPEVLPLAVYAIENGFRPWWVRLFENSYLYVAILWWLMTGRGFRNVTVGPFQIGCHWVAEYVGAEYTRNQHQWRPAQRSIDLATKLFHLPSFQFGVTMAMYRLGLLWADVRSSGQPMDAMLEEIGRRYNGSAWYGRLLVRVYKEIGVPTKVVQ